MSRSRSLDHVAWLSLAVLMTACHDSAQAPKITTGSPSPFATVTVQPLAADYPTWMGIQLLIDPLQRVHVLSTDFDPLFHRFGYSGCEVACEIGANWSPGPPDTGATCCSLNMGAVWAPGGIIAVVGRFGGGVEFKGCPGACQSPSNWTTALIVPHGKLGDDQTPSHPLAVDAAGALLLLYWDSSASALHFARCEGACTDSTSWQGLVIDSAIGKAHNATVDASIAADGSGRIHVIAATYNGGVHYLECAASCLTAGAWQTTTIDSSALTRGPSLVVRDDGSVKAVYEAGAASGACTSASCSTRVAVCSAGCTSPGAWTLTTLAAGGSDASLAVDGRSRTWIAVARTIPDSTLPSAALGSVALLHCDSNCGAASSWVTQVVDSMQGGGWISLGIDSANAPHVATSGFRVVYAQFRDTTVIQTARHITRK
jgi:hypothetical protein